jgi:hemolysin (HlyC) family protein
VPARGEVLHPIPGFEFQVLDADPRRVKRVRIARLKERRERSREPRKRGEPDAVLAGTTPPTLPIDDAGAPKPSADVPATPRRP